MQHAFVKLFCVALVASAPAAAQARVTRIVIDETLPMPAAVGAAASATPYEQVAGRAFGPSLSAGASR